jgi:hypothetical protein
MQQFMPGTMQNVELHCNATVRRCMTENAYLDYFPFDANVKCY